MRDEFSPKTRRILAERVAYRCSFSGCNRITIGPSTNIGKSICTGEASHIFSAAPKGPRSNPSLTSEQRSSIDNGIWLCKTHARLIDVDEYNYSPDTLTKWKIAAENYVYERLELMDKEPVYYPKTLIMLQDNLIIEAEWTSAIDTTWSFKILNFIIGDENKLKHYVASFGQMQQHEQFVIIESQGDGRPLSGVSLLIQNDTYHIKCNVFPKEPRTMIKDSDFDLALGDDGDLILTNNDLEIVTGVNAALQSIKLSLGWEFGWWGDPHMGSHFKTYYNSYKSNLPLLNKLIKMELIRLMTVPLKGLLNETSSPPLSIINRVNSVEIINTNSNNNIPLRLSFEWGNMEHWEGELVILI